MEYLQVCIHRGNCCNTNQEEARISSIRLEELKESYEKARSKLSDPLHREEGSSQNGVHRWEWFKDYGNSTKSLSRRPPKPSSHDPPPLQACAESSNESEDDDGNNEFSASESEYEEEAITLSKVVRQGRLLVMTSHRP